MKVRLIANGVNLVACNYDKFAIENNSLPTVVWTNTVYVFIIAHHGLKPTIMRPLISESTERPNSNQSKQKAIPSFNWRHYMWDTGYNSNSPHATIAEEHAHSRSNVLLPEKMAQK